MAIAAVEIREKGLQRVIASFKETRTQIRDFTKPLKKAGNVMLHSIDQNFENGGRPYEWMDVSGPYLRRKLREGYGGKTLIRTGHLKSSITFRVRSGKRLLVGTSVPYAAIHQFGGIIKRKRRTGVLSFGKRGGFASTRGRIRIGTFSKRVIFGAHNIVMPPREFLLFQGQDIDDINSLITEHILKAFLSGKGGA